jgi:2',3'-cyclic-nucleotide 2'-phosphodiesterase (5'-nucleotidase family)/subtilisin family serine protease
MSRKLYKIFAVLVSISLIIALPAVALPLDTRATSAPQAAPEASLDVSQAPAAQPAGHIPVDQAAPAIADDAAAEEFVKDPNGYVKIVIELADEPTAVTYAAAQEAQAPEALATEAAQAQLAKIETAQQKLLEPLAGLGATLIYRTQRVYNGIAVRVKADQLERVQQLPGVKAVHALVSKQLDLTTSVPTIGAPELWESAGLDTTGEGISIGIIDSGVDYIHADFGGPAATGAYTSNNTTVITDTYNGVPLFPTVKVAGGYDFAGDTYNADPTSPSYQPVPHPDPDPSSCLNGTDTTGHGTHVAGIAAGYGIGANGQTYAGPYGPDIDFSSFKVGPGVAPKATLYSLRVFGCNGSTDVTEQAIEWAVDPNGDGDFSDHLDVINMSLGSAYGTAYDPSAVATDNAVLAGVAVVTSSGNNNDVYYITGSPGVATRALSTASSVDRGATMDGFRVNPPSTVAGVYPGSRSVAYTGWATMTPFTTTLVYPEVGANPAQDQRTGCYTFNLTNTQMISGNIVLLDWSTPSCGGSAVRAANAYNAGAKGVIIVDDSVVFDLSIAGDARLPAYSSPKYVGDQLKPQLPASATFTNEYAGSVRMDEPRMEDVASSFTSRGPRRVDSALKPDIAAPGDTIWSAANLTGNQGKSLNGTSMASPHMAGAMALMRQLHPTWTVEELKALLMNTANHALRLDAPINSAKIGPGRIGAGRADLPMAAESDVVAYNAGLPGAVSVSFGAPEVMGAATLTRRVRVVNKGPNPLIYSASYKSSVDMPGVAYTFSPAIVMLAPFGDALVEVTMTADAAQMERTPDASVSLSGPRQWVSEESGYLLLTPGYPHKIYLPMIARGSGTGGTSITLPPAVELRVPVYAAPRAVSAMHAVPSSLSFTSITGTAAISLTGLPVATGTNYPYDVISLVSAFELQEVSPDDASSAGFFNHADLKYLGVTNDYLATGNILSTTIYFAIATQGDWTVPSSNEVQFNILIDTDRNDVPDYQLYNRQTGGATPNDVFASRLVRLSNGAGSYPAYLNAIPANVLDTAVWNNNVMVLAVPAASLGLTAGSPRFDYFVETYSRDTPTSDAVDTSAVHTFAATTPGLDFTGNVVGIPGYFDLPDTAIPVRFNYATYQANSSQGALLLHHHNAAGLRAEVIGVTPPSNYAVVSLMHTNDFHGNLEPVPASGYPGMARLAYKIKQVRNEVNTNNTLLLDAGDIMQSSLLSNLKKGQPTIDLYNYVGYNVATYGNHEFDWGQTTLISRTKEASFPFVVSNLVVNDTGNCATAGWTVPVSFTVKPWITMTVGAPGNQAVIGILGTTSIETPYITIAEATQGLCFKDPVQSVARYYNDVKAAGADLIVLLSHNGNTDGGYGYGFTVDGDQTLAKKLLDQGKPADIIIGGHSHTNLAAAQIITSTLAPGKSTAVVQAHSAGRKLGRFDLVINKTTDTATIKWTRITVEMTDPEDAATKARINLWANDPAYQAQINQVIGFSNVDLVRNYDGDNLMGALVNDSIYNDLNNDGNPANDVDMVFNNPGGLRADLTSPTKPFTLTYGMLYSVLPFGNATLVGDMTGAQVHDLLNQAATLFKGAIQVSGIRYTFYTYTDTLPVAQPWAWGAYSVTVYNKATLMWEPLVMTKTYRIATNEFLAPAGQDGFVQFKYVKNYSYWGDMLNQVNHWISMTYGTPATAYNGPNNDGLLDGRIIRNGTSTYNPSDPAQVVPVNVLHHNDAHGRLLPSGSAPGYTNLATLIKQERAHNPTRTILLNSGDTIQGDAMAAYYKAAFTGLTPDNQTLPPTLTVNPILRSMNAMTYTAMTLGNHEFNYGSYIFTGTLGQADFPLLQANIYDTGAYGLAQVNVRPHITVSLPGPAGDVNVAILGIGNHRIPQYELPSNIPGLSFTNPVTETQSRAPALQADNDAVIALTHIGFTDDPNSVEVDNNVDTYLAANSTGVDAIIGGHSHTNPSTGFGAYKFLPTFVGAPDNTPVIINQAYRYNTYLGEIVLGLLPKAGGGYEVVSRAGRYIANTTSVAQDAAIKAIVDPYDAFFQTYKNRVLGQTNVAIDTTTAFITETNGANLQVDASLWKLNQVLGAGAVQTHLSGAMTNAKIPTAASPTYPYTMTVNDMFTLMPYENSLVVFTLNGPQLKTILERAYRNYWYYKYVPNRGGYSYYTTCMLDISAGSTITYDEDPITYTVGTEYVVGMDINGAPVNFLDATTYYTVSTVNYVAAGSCNFNNGGVTLWPLNQIVQDTQYYVRDVMIDYIPTLTQPIAPPPYEGRIRILP